MVLNVVGKQTNSTAIACVVQEVKWWYKISRISVYPQSLSQLVCNEKSNKQSALTVKRLGQNKMEI